MRIPEAGPFGETLRDASVLAIVAASFVKRPASGCVESVFTDATQRFVVAFLLGTSSPSGGRVARYLARRALTMLRRAAARCAVVVLRRGRTVFRPPRGPRRVVAARKLDVGRAILSSSDISIPCLRAADMIFRRAVSFADSDENSV